MPKRRANGEGQYPKAKGWTMGGPLHSRSRSGNRKSHHQKRPRQDASGSERETEKSHRGKRRASTTDGPRPTRWEAWLEVWMENYAKVKLRPSTFKTSQGFLKNHIKPQIGSIPLADLTSLDLQRFYKHLLDGGRVDRIEAKKKPKGLAPKTVRNIHQMIGSAYNLAIEQKLVTKQSDTGLCLAEGRAQGDEDPDRRPTQRLLPGGQGQRRVRTLLPRPRHRTSAGRTAGIEVDGCGLPPRSTENSTGHLAAERQGGRSPAENEKRLPHTAVVGRRDKRSERHRKTRWEAASGYFHRPPEAPCHRTASCICCKEC